MIELEGIGRVFEVGGQEVHALRDLDLRIEAGEYVSLMGPSGSGKSTLLNTVGLLDRPTAGRYLLEGRDVREFAEKELARIRRERIGFVFQFFHLVPRFDAVENVALPLLLAGVDAGERRDRALHALERVGLSERRDHRPDQLSGGERQRVAIARALIADPAILLADEPTGNLDRTSGDEVVAILEEANASGLALVVVTHDLEIGRRARRRIRMEDGRIVEDVRTTRGGELCVP